MTKKRTFALTLCVSSAFVVVTVAPVLADAGTVVAQQIEKARRNQPADLDDLDRVQAQPPTEVLTELRKYMRDSSKGVREEVTSLARLVAWKHAARGVRQQAARLILDMLLADADNDVRLLAVNGLVRLFLRADFSDRMRQEINQLVQQLDQLGPAIDLRENIILLAGVADVRTAAPRLRQLANGGSWPAQLALARLGDPLTIHYVIDRLEGVKDEVKRVRRLDKDLAFIRQPEAVEIILKYLFSDKSTPASPPDVGSVRYSYYAAEALGEIIEGFPTGIANTEAGIARARQWVTQQLAPQPAAATNQQSPATAQATRSGGVANLKIKR